MSTETYVIIFLAFLSGFLLGFYFGGIRRKDKGGNIK